MTVGLKTPFQTLIPLVTSFETGSLGFHGGDELYLLPNSSPSSPQMLTTGICNLLTSRPKLHSVTFFQSSPCCLLTLDFRDTHVSKKQPLTSTPVTPNGLGQQMSQGVIGTEGSSGGVNLCLA